MNRPFRILVAPLNWGLGHATRCIPIIHELQAEGAEVILGGDGDSLLLLQQEFPDLNSIELPAYAVTYPENGSMFWHFLKHSPRLLTTIGKENLRLDKIIRKQELDGVISDNRFGLYTKQVPCIFMTHQLHILAPTLEKAVRKLNHRFLKRFTHCWVPDTKQAPNLSGVLGHPPFADIPTTYIGPLSRFGKASSTHNLWDVVAVVSGPEPQRSRFQDLLEKQLPELPGKHLLVCGQPGNPTKQKTGNVEVVNHLSAAELEQALLDARMVVARSGYSSVMDLVRLQKPALLIPTPGQTEQEYLAEHLMQNQWFHAVKQDALNLPEDLKAVQPAPEMAWTSDPKLLQQAVADFLATCQ